MRKNIPRAKSITMPVVVTVRALMLKKPGAKRSRMPAVSQRTPAKMKSPFAILLLVINLPSRPLNRTHDNTRWCAVRKRCSVFEAKQVEAELTHKQGTHRYRA